MKCESVMMLTLGIYPKTTNELKTSQATITLTIGSSVFQYKRELRELILTQCNDFFILLWGQTKIMLCVIVSKCYGASIKIKNKPKLQNKSVLMAWVLQFVSAVITAPQYKHDDDSYVLVDTDVYDIVDLWSGDKASFKNIIFSLLLDSSIYIHKRRATSKTPEEIVKEALKYEDPQLVLPLIENIVVPVPTLTETLAQPPYPNPWTHDTGEISPIKTVDDIETFKQLVADNTQMEQDDTNTIYFIPPEELDDVEEWAHVIDDKTKLNLFYIYHKWASDGFKTRGNYLVKPKMSDKADILNILNARFHEDREGPFFVRCSSVSRIYCDTPEITNFKELMLPLYGRDKENLIFFVNKGEFKMKKEFSNDVAKYNERDRQIMLAHEVVVGFDTVGALRNGNVVFPCRGNKNSSDSSSCPFNCSLEITWIDTRDVKKVIDQFDKLERGPYFITAYYRTVDED